MTRPTRAFSPAAGFPGQGSAAGRQRVLATRLPHLPGDGEADQRAGHVLPGVAAGERLDDGGLGARRAVGQQLEDRGRDPGHRGVDLAEPANIRAFDIQVQRETAHFRLDTNRLLAVGKPAAGGSRRLLLLRPIRR